MTITPVLLVEDDILRAYQDAWRKAPALIANAYERAARPPLQRAMVKLKTYPGRVKYPIRWKSERQRRAFFASNGFGSGIPYRRTGALKRGWQYKLTKITQGGAVLIENDTSYAQFVQGDDAQPFHLATGWTQAAPVIALLREELEDILIETWFTLTDPRAGVGS
jgi:hypothetical protein